MFINVLLLMGQFKNENGSISRKGECINFENLFLFHGNFIDINSINEEARQLNMYHVLL